FQLKFAPPSEHFPHLLLEHLSIAQLLSHSALYMLYVLINDRLQVGMVPDLRQLVWRMFYLVQPSLPLLPLTFLIASAPYRLSETLFQPDRHLPLSLSHMPPVRQ